MDIIELLHLTDAMHAISQALIVPTVAVLLLLIAYAIYTLGSLVVEVFTERREYQVALPQLIDKLDAAEYDEIDGIIDRSGLLDSQRDALHELKRHMHLPEDALFEVAKRLRANEGTRYAKALSWTDSAVKVAPMLGLMGTLIPLGPGITALGGGDLETLSTAIMTAFDTTVAGLVVAVVCYLVTKLRRRWYDDYLTSLEGAMNTLLEKARIMHEQGDFDDDGAAFASAVSAPARAISEGRA